MEIGFIGLGRMGLPMARRLIDAGHALIVNDVNTEAAATLAALGARTAASPKEVADHADTVIVSLPTPAIVEAVAAGPGGIIDGERVRRFVDLSTTGPRTARCVADALARRGITAVDCPVSGGVNGAAKGTLAVMVSCPTAVFAELEPMLAVFGKLYHVGEAPGLGQTMKLVNNYLSATALATTAEAMVFGTKAGLDPATMIEVINAGSGRNSASQDKFPRSILPGTFDFGFATGLMCKDLRLFAEEAEAAGVPLWIGSAIRQLWQHTENQFGAGSDFTSIVKPLEEWTGVEVRARPAEPRS